MKRSVLLLLIVGLVQTSTAQTLSESSESAATPAPIRYASIPQQRVFWTGKQQPMVWGAPQAAARTDALSQFAVPYSLGKYKLVADLSWADARAYAQPPASTDQSQPRASRAGRKAAGLVLIGGGVSLMVYSTAWYKNRLNEQGRQARQTGNYAPLFEEHIGWNAAATGMVLGGLFAALGGVVLLVRR